MAAGKKGPSIHVVPSQSRPGKFVVKEAGNPKPLTRPATQAASIDKGIPLVLVVDDEPLMCHVLLATLRDHYRVLIAA
jgi:hypothetical protein